MTVFSIGKSIARRTKRYPKGTCIDLELGLENGYEIQTCQSHSEVG